MYKHREICSCSNPVRNEITDTGTAHEAECPRGIQLRAEGKGAEEAIKERLRELMREYTGGGMSSELRAKLEGMKLALEPSAERQHMDMEALVVLGIATGLLKYCLPKEMWSVLPGGMPYVILSSSPDAPKD